MLEQEDILKDLKSLIPDNIIKVNEPLKRYTYTKTGGNADFYLSPTENKQVQTIARTSITCYIFREWFKYYYSRRRYQKYCD